MKSLKVTAIILSVLGIVLSVAAVYVATVAHHQLDILMDPQNGPISARQTLVLKEAMRDFLDAIAWLGLAIGAVTLAWIAWVVKARKLLAKASAKTPAS